jgi:hypothetical protein
MSEERIFKKRQREKILEDILKDYYVENDDENDRELKKPNVIPSKENSIDNPTKQEKSIENTIENTVEKTPKNDKRKAKKKLPPFDVIKPKIPRQIYALPNYGRDKYAIDMNNYRYAMSEYKKKYLEWVKRAVELEKDIPYKDRSKASLIRELEARELDCNGSRPILEERLRIHDEDSTSDKLFTSDLKTIEKLKDIEIFTEPQKGKMYGRGEDGLLGIPHSVIRTVLLRYFNEQTSEYMDLYSLAVTCKYLQADVMDVLTKRSVKLFGIGATPLSLNCLFSLQYKKVRNKVRPKGAKKYKWERKELWTIPRISSRLGVKNCNLNCGREERHLLPKKAIGACIQKYGSIEGLYKDRDKKAKLAKIRSEEKKLIQRGIPKRIENFNDGVKALGYPELIREKVNSDDISFEFIDPHDHIALSFCIFENPHIGSGRNHYYYGDVLMAIIKRYIVNEKITLSYLLKQFSGGPFAVKIIETVKRAKVANLMLNSFMSPSFPFKGYFQTLIPYFLTNKQTDTPLFFGQQVTDDILNVQLNAMLNPPSGFFQKENHCFASYYFDSRRADYDSDVSNLIVIWRKNLLQPPMSFIMERTKESPTVTIDLIKQCVKSQYSGVINSLDDIQIKKPTGAFYTTDNDKIYFGTLSF